MFATRIIANQCKHFLTTSAPRTQIYKQSLRFQKQNPVCFSSTTTATPPPTSSSTATPPSTPTNVGTQPTVITKEMAVGVHEATKLFMMHGVGMQKLKAIANSEDTLDIKTLVPRWQQMMEAYLGTQVHVLVALGYVPNESALHIYNQHLATFVQTANPETQEELRVANRDLWRSVLANAFNLNDEKAIAEMTIVEARNAMHKVSLKMMESDVLEHIAKRAANMKPTGNDAMDMANKHGIVQEALVYEVYLGNDSQLLKECGFDSGEKGYVKMQMTMAEHQSDPLVSKYIGAAMLQVLQSAGINVNDLQNASATS